TDLTAYAHQDLPFERLVEALNPTRSLAHHPLFQVVLALRSTAPRRADGEGAPALPGGLTVSGVGGSAATAAKVDLGFSVTERRAADNTPDGVSGVLDFRTDLFDHGTAQALVDRFVRVLADAAAHPDRPLSRIDVLGPRERTGSSRSGTPPRRASPRPPCRTSSSGTCGSAPTPRRWSSATSP
ncbi:hypothetical protein CJD44_28525, partial [Streptomyces sp. alain-838]